MRWKNIRGGHREGAEAMAGKFKLCIHRHIDHPSDVWLYTIHVTYGIMTRAISKDLEEVKLEAVEKLRSILTESLEELGA